MNLRDLAALLTARTADHILTLRPGDTGSAAVDALLSRNFPQGALVIDHANQKEDQTSVTVRGQMTLFGVAKVNVAAVFYVQGDAAQARIECDLPTYAFSDTTPNLSDPLLSGFRMNQVSIKLLSIAQGALAAGVTLSGNYQLPNTLNPLSWLFNNIANVTLTGSLEWVSGQPKVNLFAPKVTGVGVGGLTLDPVFVLRSDVSTFGQNNEIALASGSMVLEAGLKFDTGSGVKDLLLRMPLPQGSEWGVLPLDAVLNNVSFGDLARLGTLLGGASLSLPSEIPVADSLGLTGLTLVLSPKDKSIISASAEISSLRRWDVIPGEFAVNAVKCTFTVANPFTPAKRAVSSNPR